MWNKLLLFLAIVECKNLFKAPFESQGGFVYLLCWKTWEFNQDFSFIDRHISVGSSFSFSLLLEKSAFTKLSREKERKYVLFMLFIQVHNSHHSQEIM